MMTEVLDPDHDPIGSMYGIFTYIYHKNQPNVGKYTIHGSYGDYSYTPELRALGSRRTLTLIKMFAKYENGIAYPSSHGSLENGPNLCQGNYIVLETSHISTESWFWEKGVTFKKPQTQKIPQSFPSPPKQGRFGNPPFFAKETWTISLESAAFLGETSHWDGTFPGFYWVNPVAMDFLTIPCLQFLGVGVRLNHTEDHRPTKTHWFELMISLAGNYHLKKWWFLWDDDNPYLKNG